MTAPKYVRYGVFRLDPNTGNAQPLGPLQITQRAAAADRQILADVHGVTDGVLCEVHIKPPKDTP